MDCRPALAFWASVHNSQLLAKERVFGEQLGTDMRQVRQGTGDGIGDSRLGDSAEQLVSGVGQAIPNTLGKMDEAIEHNGVYFSDTKRVGQGGSSLAQRKCPGNTRGWAL